MLDRMRGGGGSVACQVDDPGHGQRSQEGDRRCIGSERDPCRGQRQPQAERSEGGEPGAQVQPGNLAQPRQCSAWCRRHVEAIGKAELVGGGGHESGKDRKARGPKPGVAQDLCHALALRQQDECGQQQGRKGEQLVGEIDRAREQRCKKAPRRDPARRCRSRQACRRPQRTGKQREGDDRLVIGVPHLRDAEMRQAGIQGGDREGRPSQDPQSPQRCMKRQHARCEKQVVGEVRGSRAAGGQLFEQDVPADLQGAHGKIGCLGQRGV